MEFSSEVRAVDELKSSIVNSNLFSLALFNKMYLKFFFISKIMKLMFSIFSN